MNDTVTIVGHLGNDPIRNETPTGITVVKFRVASPQRRYDAKTQAWIETGTNWYNVSAFRQLAEHAKASLRSGDAVIVTGKLKLREWEANGKRGINADIDAEAIGHDLRWGTSAFAKASRAVPAQTPYRDEDATSAPADDGLEDSYEADDDDEPAMAMADAPWATTT